MSRPIEALMNEHRLIEAVLDSLGAFTGAVRSGETRDRETAGRYVRFFRTFADRCHHGKEEDLLFDSLCEHGFSREFGPVMVMLGEHNVGRARVGEMAAVAEGEGPMADEDRTKFCTSAEEFTDLLRNHIVKEDRILFPAAEQNLPSGELDRLAGAFEEFERGRMGEDVHEQMHALAESLIEAYPPVSTGPKSTWSCTHR